jgi:pyruvate dehydrogenase E2 component (dihydrolipoamide acetyltransferase)
MITKVVLAKLSPTMEEGTIVKWAKKEGDKVKTGDVLAEIETDKANMEMEALGDGVLRKILVQAGGKAPVGALIGVIADPKDNIEDMLKEAPADGSTPSTSQPSSAKPTGPTSPAQADVPATGATVEQQNQPGPGPAPAPPPPPAPPAPAGPAGRVKASPLARSMAAQGNVPLESLSGSGPGGRIIKRDVESWLATPRPAEPPAARPGEAPPAPKPSRPAIPVPSVKAGTAIPLTNMRRTIAKRLAESKFTAPHFYVTVEIDMDAAVALRDQLMESEDVKLSYNDLVLKACAKALTRFPTVNASWTGEAIQTHAEVHLGVAVSLPEGLITPVVRDADKKHVVEISREVKDLAARARDKKLKPEEFSGSTFTVSNLGMMDVTEFTAIINPPEAAILAVGAVRRVPVVQDDHVAVGHRMRVTLSCDHRVVDGALGAQFLAEVRRLLEKPVSLLL